LSSSCAHTAHDFQTFVDNSISCHTLVFWHFVGINGFGPGLLFSPILEKKLLTLHQFVRYHPIDLSCIQADYLVFGFDKWAWPKLTNTVNSVYTYPFPVETIWKSGQNDQLAKICRALDFKKINQFNSVEKELGMVQLQLVNHCSGF
jgi:hypothetical protein